ncbi:hypothetical protein PCY08_05055 [Streptococcus sp. SO4]|uniref:hypothetical protein n=1 Tax=Streptococcus sp. SO4 TaxID=3018249 RepID=UPI00263DAD3B|nr:hypothetical protein [Streptococcus sp. SO4]MDN5024808.1 hypothetical protein [Streptococcus sp. SO4]
MERLVFIGLLVFLALLFIGIVLGLRSYLKRNDVNGVPVYDAPANEQTRTGKLSLKENIFYISMILISLAVALFIMSKFRHGAAPIGSAIVTSSIMAYFNARKRTGKSWIYIVAVLMVFVFLMFAYILIGLPDKAPALMISNTEIKLSETKVSDLMDKGYDIYVSNSKQDYSEYDELLTSGSYTKYQGSGVTVPSGFKSYDSAVTRSTYLLVKKNVVVGCIGVYGHKKRYEELKDCVVTQVCFDSECTAAAKKYGISYNIDGIDLLEKLDENKFKEVFGKKIWLTPSNPRGEYLGHYGVQWGTGNNEFFWNQYFMNLDIDSNNNLVNFSFKVHIAGERENN